MNRSLSLAALATAGFAAGALAPALDAQGTITDGQVTYTVGAIGPGQSDSVNSDFTGNPGADPDVLFEHWWFYRVAGDADETAFNSVNLTQNYSGSHADLDWANVDNRGLFDASLDIDVRSTGVNSGVAVSRMTITNLTENPLSVTVFAYADVDHCTAANNTVIGNPERQLVRGPCTAFNDRVEFFGTCIDRYCVESFDGSECDILDPGPTDLSNIGLPFPAGDYTGAIKWTELILPGDHATLTSSLAHNVRSCAGGDRQYGPWFPGVNGVPLIDPELALIGRSFRFFCRNGTPDSTAVLGFGLFPVFERIGNITLLVQPLVLLSVATTSPDYFVLQPVPNSVALCGLPIYAQWVAQDDSVPGGLSQTRAIKIKVGAY